MDAAGADGSGCFGLGVWLVGVRRWPIGVALILLSLPGWLAVRLGQLAFWWILILAVVLFLLRCDRQVSAGVVASILVLKPQLAVAVALWWLISHRRHRRALIALLSASVAITIVSFSLTPGAANGFLDAIRSVAQSSKAPIVFSPAAAMHTFIPSLPDPFNDRFGVF